MKDLKDLAEMVCCGVATPEKIKLLGLRIKAGKSFEDVLRASFLRLGQPPGDFERMVAHVEKNLEEVVEHI